MSSMAKMGTIPLSWHEEARLALHKQHDSFLLWNLTSGVHSVDRVTLL